MTSHNKDEQIDKSIGEGTRKKGIANGESRTRTSGIVEEQASSGAEIGGAGSESEQVPGLDTSDIRLVCGIDGQPKKAEIFEVIGGLILRTPSQQTRVNTVYELVGELRTVFRDCKGDREEPENQKGKFLHVETCRHCGSDDTTWHCPIHGTGKRRRRCNKCGRTYTVEPVDNESLKTQVSFLTFCFDSAEEIAEMLLVPINVVKTYQSDGMPVISLAEGFDLSEAPKQRIGTSLLWDYDGRYGIGKRGVSEVVFISKTDAEYMKRIPKLELQGYLRSLPQKQRELIILLIDNMLDDEQGILPKVGVSTRPMEDGGEIDVDSMQSGYSGSVGDSGNIEVGE